MLKRSVLRRAVRVAVMTLMAWGWTHAKAADPVTVVRRPLMNRPALVKAGESFTVECLATSGGGSYQVNLVMPYHTTGNLSVGLGNYANGVQSLSVAVPSDTPFELYDLVVNAPSGVDTVRHAVRVLSAFKNSFSFVHLPDCHLPAVSWVGFYDDDNTVPEFLQILDEINLLNPEFVLQTGDLVDNGQSDAQYAQAQSLCLNCEVPLFITGGNHDLWYDGHDQWHRYFGQAMDYDFLYGDTRFVGLEMYDIPGKTYTAAQMTWLRSTLDRSITQGEAGRILFTHYDESRQITGTLVDQYQVDGLFYGHTHLNGETTLGLRQAPKINTSYTMNDNGEYRLVRVTNGQVTDYPLLKFRHLWTNISPANDGTAWTMRAEVHNDTDVDLEGVLVKLHLDNYADPVAVSGTILQSIVYGGTKRVVYMTTDVAAHSTAMLEVNNGLSGAEPPRIETYSPTLDTTIYGGQTLTLSATANRSLAFAWTLEGSQVKTETGTASTYAYHPALEFEGQVQIAVQAAEGPSRDEKRWTVYVKKSSGKPELISDSRNFFPYDETLVMEWTEPVASSGYLDYGLLPGQYIGSIPENGNNRVAFVPQAIGMGLGVYFCRIRSGGLASDEFPIVIESPQAPQMVGPVGNIQTLKPVFEWEAVQGVPFYFVILTDQEVILTEDDEGNYSLEGANPIWAVLTSETSVPYGTPDPSGTFTSSPAPLARGQEYWWVVLNCYGNAPELTSTVQSGVSRFKVDLPLPDLPAPGLMSPADGATLSGETIAFRWQAVAGAMGYNFYPYKIEIEEGIEVVRPIWETVMTTTNTLIEYEAAKRMVQGRYQWRVAALDADGTESPSKVRNFSYDAPVSTLNLYTKDSRGTVATSDDKLLPRVSVAYDAISGVDMGLPLSTDDSGSRTGLVFTPGTYQFTATKEGFEPSTVTLALAEGQTVSHVFRMTPDPSTVTGKVADGEGKAVAAATVTAQHSLHPEITRKATSAQNGDFSVSLSPGPWQIQAAKTGYQSGAAVSVSIVSGQALALSAPLSLTKNKNTLTGTVVNTAGKPVYGVKVSLSGSNLSLDKSTDSDGLFSFSLPDGSYTLTVSKSGFSPPSPRSVSVSGGKVHELTPSLVLTPAATLVSGTVTDGRKAVAAATVKATPTSGTVVTVQTDGYGQYSLSLASGSYRLTASKTGYSGGAGVDIALNPGETVSGVGLVLSANSGSVSGLVTSDGFTPLPGATVSIDGQSVSTDDAGAYAIAVAAGSYAVTAEKSGYLSGATQNVVVGPGQAVQGIHFTLTPNASVVSGQVVYNGAGVAGAAVIATGDATRSATSDDGGGYTLSLEAGDYQIHAEKSGFVSTAQSIEVGQAQTLEEQDIAMQRNVARLRGRVAEMGGTAVMNAQVRVSGGQQSTTTKADGSYLLELTPSATGATIVVSKAGYMDQSLVSPVLTAGSDQTLDFSLAAASTRLSGKVVDDRGQAVEGAAVTVTLALTDYTDQSAADGGYALDLPTGGSGSVVAEKAGYLFTTGAQSFSLQAGETRTGFHLTLTRNFSRIKGRLQRASDQALVAGAQVRLSDVGGLVATTLSDEQGNYDFVSEAGEAYLASGGYSLTVVREGFEEMVPVPVDLAGGATLTVDLSLTALAEHLAGTVTDGSVPVSSATVTAVNVATSARSSQVTGEAGTFRLDGLAAGDYRVSVSRSGYAWAVDQVVTASQDGLTLQLAANTGRILGRITDLETGAGLSGVAVAVSDGHGNALQVTSADQGVYDTGGARLLPTVYAYTLSLSRAGYVGVSGQAVSATASDSIHFGLQRLYGTVSGGVKALEDSTGMGDVVVKVQSGATAWMDTTDSAGHYAFGALPAADYTLTVQTPGYLSSPASQSLNLWSGPQLTGVDVYLEAVELAELAIDGPTLVQSGSAAGYGYAARTTDGRLMGVDPQWSVDATGAVDSVTADGLIYPKDDFIGPMMIRLTDGYTGAADSLQIHVVATLEPGDGARTFSDYRGGVVQLDTNSVVQPVTFGLKYPRLSPVKRVLNDYQAVGEVYALQPAYLVLNRPMTVTLPLEGAWIGQGGLAKGMAGSRSSAAGPVALEDVRVGMWDGDRLAWDIRQGTAVTGGLSIQSDTLAQWTVMLPSEGLGIRDFSALPNPFSPVLGPVTLSFTPTSREATHLVVSIKLYNLNGDPVRTLMEDEPVIKDQPCTVQWDGRTDSGGMGRNGRYLVHIEARDGKDTARLLRSVVLVK